MKKTATGIATDLIGSTMLIRLTPTDTIPIFKG
jgi:hypothetical protein